jgi:predicted Zn-dependent peptidase
MRVYRAFLDDSIVHIYYCGARPKQQLLDFSDRIAAFHPTAPRAMIDYPSLPMVSRVKRRARAAHVRQSQVVCAYQIDLGQKDPLWAHLSIFDAVLSASPKAKLFSQVREKLSLCYSCYGIADRIGRIYYITAGVEPGSEQEAIREIHSVVQEMQSGKIRVEELRDAQNHLLYGYASMSDMPDAYETWYFHNLFTGGFTDLTKSMEFTGHETVDDITAFASHLHLAAEVVIRGVDESGEVTP